MNTSALEYPSTVPIKSEKKTYFPNGGIVLEVEFTDGKTYMTYHKNGAWSVWVQMMPEAPIGKLHIGKYGFDVGFSNGAMSGLHGNYDLYIKEATE